jgi:glycosyltransferase involved in cell wall biosynthesis
MEKKPLRIANFMDNSLEDLDKKGNLHHALFLYNPKEKAESVTHFTPWKKDIKYQNSFSERNIEIFPFSWEKKRKLPFLKHILAFFEILKKIKSQKINIIRGRQPYLGSFMGCICGKILNIPSVVSLGGDIRISQRRSGQYVFGKKFISFTMEHLTLRICDKIIVPNKFTKEYVASIIGRGKAYRKIVEIPWALVDEEDNKKVTNVDQLKLDLKKPIILVVGFLNRYKYSDVIFEVVNESRNTILKKTQFVFCGDGPLKERGKSLFANENNVRFLGWQDNETVKELIRHSTIVLIPMSGYVLLEAAREGKAVIASNVEWHPEVIIDGETGFLVEPTSVTQWKEKISRVLENDKIAVRLGDNLKKVFNSRFTSSKLLDKEIDLYESLI